MIGQYCLTYSNLVAAEEDGELSFVQTLNLINVFDPWPEDSSLSVTITPQDFTPAITPSNVKRMASSTSALRSPSSPSSPDLTSLSRDTSPTLTKPVVSRLPDAKDMSRSPCDNDANESVSSCSLVSAHEGQAWKPAAIVPLELMAEKAEASKAENADQIKAQNVDRELRETEEAAARSIWAKAKHQAMTAKELDIQAQELRNQLGRLRKALGEKKRDEEKKSQALVLPHQLSTASLGAPGAPGRSSQGTQTINVSQAQEEVHHACEKTHPQDTARSIADAQDVLTDGAEGLDHDPSVLEKLERHSREENEPNRLRKQIERLKLKTEEQQDIAQGLAGELEWMRNSLRVARESRNEACSERDSMDGETEV